MKDLTITTIRPVKFIWQVITGAFAFWAFGWKGFVLAFLLLIEISND